MPKRRKEPSQTWKTFLSNHVGQLVSIDFFTVPTLQLRVLFVFVVLAHQRRRVLHFNVTEHPTAEWAAQQIVDPMVHGVSVSPATISNGNISPSLNQRFLAGLVLAKDKLINVAGEEQQPSVSCRFSCLFLFSGGNRRRSVRHTEAQ